MVELSQDDGERDVSVVKTYCYYAKRRQKNRTMIEEEMRTKSNQYCYKNMPREFPVHVYHYG